MHPFRFHLKPFLNTICVIARRRRNPGTWPGFRNSTLRYLKATAQSEAELGGGLLQGFRGALQRSKLLVGDRGVDGSVDALTVE